ncbi:MAG: beta-lactamase family protein [Saprospiraceae bacterium]|nr:beta-lactamase family protein [Saprospiraceae bacterium]
MTIRILSTYCLVFLVGFQSTRVFGQERQELDNIPIVKEALDSICQTFIESKRVAGGVCMIQDKTGIFYQNAFGMQSIEDRIPMTLNSLFRIASMTKPLTSLAVLILVDEGLLSLDDNVSDYLPQIADLPVRTRDSRIERQKMPVTIRHLLTHTSGLRSAADPWFEQNNIPFNEASSLREFVDLLLKAPLISQPGEEFNYAMNNDVCARIIEVITGSDFGLFLNERILIPLQMYSTSFIVSAEDLPRLSSVYQIRRDSFVLIEGRNPVQSNFARGNGHLVSSAGDYMNFLKMLLNDGAFNGKRIISKSGLQKLWEDILPSQIQLKVGSTAFPDSGFGLSVAISRGSRDHWKPLPVSFENLFRHLPAGSFSWPGIVNTYFWVDPDHKIAGVVLSQMVDPLKSSHFQLFTQAFYTHFLGH